ncbi:MAG: hypothetical protein WA294_18200 [Acidobacteriaceae bacterium]
MALLVLHSWIRFGVGLLAGCWIGVVAGIAIAILLASRRIQDLESANLLLQMKLQVREKARRTGTEAAGPTLVPPGDVNRPASAPRRAAS